MITATEKIYQQALNIPTDERLLLIDKLLTSTNLTTYEEINKAWSKEVEKRCNEIENGEAKLIDGKKVFAKVKKRFSK